eukprot:257749-Rhodomonas_salina.2
MPHLQAEFQGALMVDLIFQEIPPKDGGTSRHPNTKAGPWRKVEGPSKYNHRCPQQMMMSCGSSNLAWLSGPRVEG